MADPLHRHAVVPRASRFGHVRIAVLVPCHTDAVTVVRHRFGNRVLTRCVATLFGRTFTDMLDTVTHGRRETKRFAYLNQRGPADHPGVS